MGHWIATRIAKLVGALQVASSNDFSMSNLSLRLRTPFLFSLPRSQNLADAVKTDYETNDKEIELGGLLVFLRIVHNAAACATLCTYCFKAKRSALQAALDADEAGCEVS